MEKNWPSRVALFCKCIFLSPAKISVFIHFHLQSIEPAWGEYKCTLISERTLRSYQKRKTRRFLWELGSISRNQWVVCYSENVGVDNCRFDLTLQHLHCLCWWHTTWEPPLLVFVTNESAQVGAVCQSQVPTKVRQTERLHVHACVQFISVQSLSRVRLFVTHESQQTRPPCPSPTPGVHSDSRPSSQWCHPAISSSVIPFSSRPQSLPASQSFPTSQLFAWGGQRIGVSASASVLPLNFQGWSPLRWTGSILVSKGLSRVFSNTTVQKQQFFSAQPSSQSNSHIHTWPQEKPQPWLDRPLLAK